MEPTAATIERAYRVRCYPTKQQARTLAQLLGAKRFVWNWALARRRQAYRESKQNVAFQQLSSELTQLRKQPKFCWLGALPREPFTQVLRDLERAYSNFFAGLARFPKFKRKKFAGAVRFTLDQRRTQVDREKGRVQIDGVGKLKFKVTEELEGRLRSATVSRDSAGRFFISFTADGVSAKRLPVPVAPAVGIDQGVRDLLVTSANDHTPVSRALAVRQARLRRYQRSQNRKMRVAMKAAGLDPSKRLPKGTRLKKSKRFERNRIRIARLHAEVRDARQDLVHQATSALVMRHALIGIENLSVKGMLRGLPRLRRHVANACMGEVRRQLTYKCAWAGRKLIRVDRFFPSSKLCSSCGWKNECLELKDRRWRCAQCGAEHDRDLNAAQNILAEALRIAAAEVSYPQERGEVTREECHEHRAQDICHSGLDTLNRELNVSPLRARQRRTRRDRVKAAAA